MTGNKVEMPSIINFKNTAKGDVDMLARSNS